MTDAHGGVALQGLSPIPPWAYDPRERAADTNQPAFGVVVQPLTPDHEFDIAPLGRALNASVEAALNSHGRFCEFCDVESPPEGHRDTGRRLEVKRGTDIIRDKDTGH